MDNGASLELGRNRRGPEEGRDDVDARHSARLRRGLQDLEFIGGPESVSPLPLDRRRAEGEHGPKAIRPGTRGIFFLGLTRPPHGVGGPPPPPPRLPVVPPPRLPPH